MGVLPCRAPAGDELQLVLECAALQALKDFTPTLFESVLSTRCFLWQENMVLIFMSV